MRLYTFHNWYLGGNQSTIQSLHSTARLFLKYQPTLEQDPMVDMLYDWAANHETAVVLNGGDKNNLEKLYELISGINKFPFAAFVEPGVGDSITNIALVLPTDLCDHIDNIRNTGELESGLNLDENVLELLFLISKSRLM